MKTDYYDDFITNVLSEENIEAIQKISLGSNSYPFQTIVTPLRSLRAVLTSASEAFEYLTNASRRQVDDKLNDIRNGIRGMVEFNAMNMTDPGRVAQNLLESTRSNVEFAVDRLLPVAGMRDQNVDVLAYEDKLKEFEKEYLNVLELTRFNQAQIGTHEGSMFFWRLKRTYDVYSIIYIIGLVVSVGLTAWFSYYWHFSMLTALKALEPGLTTADRLAIDVPYLSLLAVAWFAIRFFARNFRNAQHLRILNDTKATILSTGLNFSNSVSDPAIQNLILKATFESTLTVGDTAYLVSEKDGPSLENVALISILKSIVAKP